MREPKAVRLTRWILALTESEAALVALITMASGIPPRCFLTLRATRSARRSRAGMPILEAGGWMGVAGQLKGEPCAGRHDAEGLGSLGGGATAAPVPRTERGVGGPSGARSVKRTPEPAQFCRNLQFDQGARLIAPIQGDRSASVPHRTHQSVMGTQTRPVRVGSLGIEGSSGTESIKAVGAAWESDCVGRDDQPDGLLGRRRRRGRTPGSA